MKMVIDISEELYKEYVNIDLGRGNGKTIVYTLLKAIKKGTPLPHGKWLDKKMTIKGSHGLAYGRYGCSVCKKKQPSKTNFCPNCGADMRESEE